MKQIALSLFVIAASGAYVWEQSGKTHVDDMLSSALPADAAAPDSRRPAIPAAPVGTASAPTPASPELRQSSMRQERHASTPPAIGKKTTAAIAAPAAKTERPATGPLQAMQAPAPQPTALTHAAVKPTPGIAVAVREAASFAVTPAVYIPIPKPRPDYRQMPARIIRTGMKATTTNPATRRFADGTYAGPVTDAYYGPMQIQAIIQSGRLAALKVLKYPSDRRTSIRINREALPMLRDEAISAQSANVDIISGATLTSRAFIQSLGGALKKASL